MPGSASRSRRTCESEAGQVLAGVADVESLSRLNKARCIAAALAQLDCRAGETTVSEILQGCACEFSPSRIAAIKWCLRIMPK